MSGFKFNACKLAECGLNLKNASRKIKHSNLYASPIFLPFYIGQSNSRRWDMRRYRFAQYFYTTKIMLSNHVVQ